MPHNLIKNSTSRMTESGKPRFGFVRTFTKVENSVWAALILVIIFGVIFFSQISVRSTWADEACSIYAVSMPGLSDTMRYIYNDVHPPLYFLLLKGWILLFETTVEDARALSLVLTIISLMTIYFTARRFFSARAGFWTLLVIGLSPYLVYHSVHARMYSMLFLLSSLGLLAGLLFQENYRLRYLILFVLSLASLLYTHYIGAFVVAGLMAGSIFVSIKSLRKVTAWIFAGGLILALFGPWFPIFFKQLDPGSIGEGSTRFMFQPLHLKYFIKIISPLDHASLDILVGGSALTIMALLLYGVYEALKTTPRDKAYWLISGLVFSLIFFIAAACFKPLVITRTMIIFVPFMAILVGIGMSRSPPALRGGIALVLIVAWIAMIPELSKYRLHRDWRSAVAYLDQNFQPHDVVILDRSTTFCEYIAFQYYLSKAKARGEIYAGRNLFRPLKGEAAVPDLPFIGRRLFFIEPNEKPNQSLHETLQRKGFVLQKMFKGHEIAVYCFNPREKGLSPRSTDEGL